MYNFDGDFKRRPMQNLGGYSIATNRETLIRKSQEQRKKRLEQRQQNTCSIKIQSYIRSFLSRKQAKSTERINFDEFLKVNKNNLEAKFDANNISYLLQRFVFFYNSGQDSERLVSVFLFVTFH